MPWISEAGASGYSLSSSIRHLLFPASCLPFTVFFLTSDPLFYSLHPGLFIPFLLSILVPRLALTQFRL
jgi:hypothetical protein